MPDYYYTMFVKIDSETQVKILVSPGGHVWKGSNGWLREEFYYFLFIIVILERDIKILYDIPSSHRNKRTVTRVEYMDYVQCAVTVDSIT